VIMCSEENYTVVEIIQSCKAVAIDTDGLEKLVKSICSRFTVEKATISIAVVNDADITRVNKEFLNRDYATDVISFNLSNETDQARTFELVVNADKAKRQGQLRGHSPQAELALYVVHGLLHNLGFDDAKPGQADKMHALEDEILQEFGYGTVYNKQPIKTDD